MSYKFLDKSLIIGEGGAGIKIVEQLIKENPELNYSMVVSSDSEKHRASRNKDNLKRIINLNFDGSGKNLKLAYDHSDIFKNGLNDMIREYDFIFHIFGSGGGTGAGTALNIANNNPDKKHIFLMTIPNIKYESEIVKNNSLETIKTIYNNRLGKMILFNNKKTEEISFYKQMNKKIAKKINYLFILSDKEYKVQDIDSGTMLEFLFKGYESGLISINNLKYNNKNDIEIEKMMDFRNSLTYLPKSDTLDRIIVEFEIPKKTGENYIEKMNNIKESLSDKYLGADLYFSCYEKNDISEMNINLLISNPIMKDFL